jgi:hypothetical protein
MTAFFSSLWKLCERGIKQVIGFIGATQLFEQGLQAITGIPVKNREERRRTEVVFIAAPIRRRALRYGV